jgi:hypothetical protein
MAVAAVIALSLAGCKDQSGQLIHDKQTRTDPNPKQPTVPRPSGAKCEYSALLAWTRIAGRGVHWTVGISGNQIHGGTDRNTGSIHYDAATNPRQMIGSCKSDFVVKLDAVRAIHRIDPKRDVALACRVINLTTGDAAHDEQVDEKDTCKATLFQ